MTQPKDFTPRGAFQTEGTKFILEHTRCNLFCDMGLGKTIMTLNAIDILILSGFDGKFLVIAPKRVAESTWKDEAARWRHLTYLKVSPIVGTVKERLAALNAEADIFCTNYENLEWLVKQLNGEWPFSMIIADESQRLKSHRANYSVSKTGKTFLRCTGASRAKAIARLAFTKTERFVNLTGTPASNGLKDLWGQLWFIDRGKRLGDCYSAFENRWYRKVMPPAYTPAQRKKRQFPILEMLPHSEKEIRDALADVTFTLRAEDYLELGSEITNTIVVDMPPKARKLYNEMEKKLYIEIKAGAVEAFSAAAKSQKCHQIANGSVYYDTEGNWELIHDSKIEALQSVIEEAGGTPVLVVYQFKSDLIRLKKAFPKGKHLDKNKQTEYDFKQGKIPILFLHPDNPGIDGFHLVTNIICFFSVDWNMGNRQQIIARIGAVRQFQANTGKTVLIHQIVARSTIDEDILDRIESKKTVEEALKAGLARRNLK